MSEFSTNPKPFFRHESRAMGIFAVGAAAASFLVGVGVLKAFVEPNGPIERVVTGSFPGGSNENETPSHFEAGISTKCAATQGNIVVNYQAKVIISGSGKADYGETFKGKYTSHNTDCDAAITEAFAASGDGQEIPCAVGNLARDHALEGDANLAADYTDEIGQAIRDNQVPVLQATC